MIRTSVLFVSVLFKSLKMSEEPIDDSRLEDVEDETTPLISQPSRKSIFKRHKRCSVFSVVLFLVILAIGLTIYFSYYHGIVALRVFAFNVWGMPGGLGGCKYKAERMKALADVIKSRKPYFDLLLFEELWMEADHNLLQAAANETGLYMTDFRQLASRCVVNIDIICTVIHRHLDSYVIRIGI